MSHKSKAKAQHMHFERRFHERYGVFPNKQLLQEISHYVHSGHGENCYRRSNRVVIFQIPTDQLPELRRLLKELMPPFIQVVYDKERHEPVTCGEFLRSRILGAMR